MPMTPKKEFSSNKSNKIKLQQNQFPHKGLSFFSLIGMIDMIVQDGWRDGDHI